MSDGERLPPPPPLRYFASFCFRCDEPIAQVFEPTPPREQLCAPCRKELQEEARAREDLRCAVCAKRDDAAAPFCNSCRLAVVRGVRRRLRGRGAFGRVVLGLLDRPEVQARFVELVGRPLAALIDPADHGDC